MRWVSDFVGVNKEMVFQLDVDDNRITRDDDYVVRSYILTDWLKTNHGKYFLDTMGEFLDWLPEQ